jgi:hypothetical protein
MNRRRARGNGAVVSFAIGALLLGICASAACGKDPGAFGVGPGSGHIGSGGDGGPGSPLPGSDAGLLPTDDSSSPVGSLVIAPLAPVVSVVTGKPLPTVSFSAKVSGSAVTAVWILDKGELGSINKTGLFTPAGNIAGTGNVSATYGGVTVKTTITVNIQSTDQGDPGYVPSPPPPGPGGYGGVGGDGPGAPPSPGQGATLGNSPTADPSVRLLYPYDGTVWPQALLAPLLQWNPGSHSFDSVYVHIQEKSFEYKGYFAANKMPFVNLPIPQAAWTTMGFSNGGEPVTISLVFGEGSKAYGPYTETWKIAQGSLQGTIYYNSYGTSLVQNSDSQALDYYNKQYGAGTLAIAPGATAPKLVAGINSISATGNGTGCRVCHTASADGTTLVTQASSADANSYAGTVYVNLANDTTAGAGTPIATSNLAFPALYRDGSLLFSNAAVMNGPADANLIPGDGTSKLYSLPAGTLVPGVTGLPPNFAAGLPSFSPDGKHVSFNFYGGSLPSGATGDQISLGVIDFDGSKTFSNPHVVYTPTGSSGGDPAVIYSSFLPSSSALVFELELSNGGDPNDWGYTWAGSPSNPPGHTSELWWLDLTTGKSHRLDELNGYDSASGTPYLPDNAGGAATHTSAQDVTVNYEPTVTPIASGGYAWVVFTSRRLYGNVATLGPWVSDPHEYAWHDPGNVTPKKLWVAAIDLNAAPGTDASHPAFYLPGQELYAGNSRGYWTIPPCRPDGTSCDVGDECCGGFCERGADGGLVCTAQMPMCAALYEKCTTTSDCCNATTQDIQCINQVCTAGSPPK